MISLRACAIRVLSSVSVFVSIVLAAQPAQSECKHPWHLCADCPTCLSMSDVWDRYGVGHPDIAVMVAEREIFADTRAAGSWHAGIAARRFELLLDSGDPSFVPSERSRSLADWQNRQEEGLTLFDKLTGKSGRPGLGAVSTRTDICSFVRRVVEEGPRNHDLQMVSLIGGQPYQDTSGVAPGTHVILTKATIEPSSVDLLKDLIVRRPEIRVVNFSQGQGRVTDESAVDTAHPHRLHYQDLDKLVMELSVAGMLETRARSATRFLVVASSGNVPAFESDIFEPQEVLDVRIPSEAIYLAMRSTPAYIDLRPHYLRDMPHIDLPLLVVGAVGAAGTLPSYGRVDQGIDIYAPAGIDWIAHVHDAHAADPRRQSLGGVQWRECVCVALVQDHPRLGLDPAYDKTCGPLKEDADWFQLGVPALDFHTNAINNGATSTQLRANCADRPTGLCTSISDGTSAAAALVSGVAALMFALDPSQSGEEAAEILKSTARTDNPLRLPVVDPGAALKAVVQRIGARLFDEFKDPTRLSSLFGAPFYYVFHERERYAFTDRTNAASFVSASFASQGRGTWHVVGVRDSQVQRCSPGIAGSTIGIERLLQSGEACSETETGVETLRLELDVSDGLGNLAVGVVWRRAGRLGPDADWRVAGMSVRRG